MRIAFFTHYTQLYGANRSLVDLLTGLQRFDVLPHVIAPEEGDVTSLLRERGVPVSVIPFWWCVTPRYAGGGLRTRLRFWLGPVERFCRNLRLIPRISKQLDDWSIELVHSNSSVISIGAMAAKFNALPHVWHLREFGDLDYNLSTDFGRAFQKYLIGKADARIAVSHSVLNHYRDQITSSDHVIYNGVAGQQKFDELLTDAKQRMSSATCFTFVLVGVIHVNKGQAEAVRALALVKKKTRAVRLLLVGQGNTEALQRLCEELGVSDLVKFCGHLSDPYEACLKADAGLMCSRQEAMGRVTAEAMAAGLPVIGLDAGGTSEIISHERTGLLYLNSSEELAACMLRLIDDPGFAKTLGVQGWQDARNRFSIETYAASVHRVYKTVCPSTGKDT